MAYERPWCCPDPGNCTPIMQLRDGEARPLDEAQPGQSWFCWGAMRETHFQYDGVTHENDLHSCTYTPLKGVVMFQENRADWEALAVFYDRAARALDLRASEGGQG